MIVVSRPTSLAGQSWQSCGPRPAPATSLGQVARLSVPCETVRFAAVQTVKRVPAGQGEGCREKGEGQTGTCFNER